MRQQAAGEGAARCTLRVVRSRDLDASTEAEPIPLSRRSLDATATLSRQGRGWARVAARRRHRKNVLILFLTQVASQAMLGIPGPRRGAQGLASQVWVTADRQDRLTRGDVSMALRWWPARDTPARVGRWLQRPFADGRRGGQRRFTDRPGPLWGEAARQRRGRLREATRDLVKRAGHKTPCAGGPGRQSVGRHLLSD